MRPAPDASEIRRIGCLMLNSVGDILCTTPAIAALRERYPQARITLMVRPHMRALVEDHPAVDDLVLFGSGSLGERLAFVREARRRRFDLWVDLHTPTFNTVSSNARNFLRNALLMLAAAPRYRRAYATAQLAPFLTHPLPVPSDAALVGMNVVDLTVALGWPAPGRRYAKCLAVSARDREWAAAGLPPGGPRRIALFFGTRQPANAWPAGHQLELSRRILEMLPDVELVLVGDRTDQEGARRILDGLEAPLRARARDFTGRANLAQTGALLARCAAIVATNSGGMHIADATGIPIVALFSMHNHPGVWNPVNGNAIVLYHEIACGPCFRSVCPVGNACMASITPDEAFAALLRVLPPQEARAASPGPAATR